MQKNNPFGLVNGLQLNFAPSSDAERAAEEKRVQYRRRYWQRYRQQVRRVFGTVPPEDYTALEERARKAGRSVWAQVWAEAKAYRETGSVPTDTIEANQRALLIEMRRIGNNINQLAKQGHIIISRTGGIEPSDDSQISASTLRLFTELEETVKHLSLGVKHPPVDKR